MSKVTLPPARRNCIACGLLAPPSAEGSPLCEECSSRGIAYAVELIERYRTFSDTLVAQMNTHVIAALQALSESDRQRWRAFDVARKQVADGKADDETKRKVEAMVKALKAKSLKVATLVDVYVAEEAWWWAATNQEIRYKRANELLGILEAWQQKQQEVPA